MRKLNVSKWLLIAIMLNLTGSIAAANNPQLANWVNNIAYTIVNGEASVSGLKEDATEMKIPEKVTIDGTQYNVTSVASSACRAHATLTKVSFPATMRTIGTDAFAECYALSDVTFKEGIETLSARCFTNCRNIVSLDLPSTITSLGVATFAKCKALKTVNMPASLKVIGDSTFAYDTFLTDLTLPEGLQTIGAYAFANAGLTKITIPSSVTSFGVGTFKGNTKIRTIYLRETVPSLPDLFCYGASSLTTVYVENSMPWTLGFANMKSIGRKAFMGTKLSSSATFGPGLVSIGDSAYYGTNISSINIPANVKKIGDYCFAKCVKLNTLSVSEGIEVLPTGFIDGATALKKCYLPLSVKVIGENAFRGTVKLENFALMNGLTTLGAGSLSGIALSEIVLPPSVTSVGANAFAGCTALQSVILGNKVTKINAGMCANVRLLNTVVIPEGVTEAGDTAFANCPMLTNVSLPSTFGRGGAGMFKGINISSLNVMASTPPEMGEGAFEESIYSTCTVQEPAEALARYQQHSLWKKFAKLQSAPTPEYKYKINNGNATITCVTPRTIAVAEIPATIGDNCPVVEIGSNAFSSKPSLQKVVIPASVKKIGSNAFSNCKSLTSVTINEGTDTIAQNAFFNCCALKEITLPKTVKYVGHGCFQNDYLLEKVNIPEGVDSLGHSIFMRCYNLKQVSLPSTLKAIQIQAFCYTYALEHLDIPKGVNAIGYLSLAYTGLRSIAIPDSAKRFGDFACAENMYLKKATLPEGLNQIPDYFFNSCKNLEECNFPSSLKVIGRQAFDETALKEAILPDGLTTLRVNAFLNCRQLKKARVPGTVSTWESTTFSGDWSLTDVELCEGLTEVAYGAFLDCNHLARITIPSTVKKLAYSSFNCAGLEEITLPEGLITVDGYAVSRNKFKSITFPASVINVGNNILANSPNLETVKVGAGWKIIPTSCFLNCPKLTTIEIPEGVTETGNNAFRQCPSLEKLTLPSSITKCGNYMFYQSTNLKELTVLATTPPTFGGTTPFPVELYSSCTLLVPASAIDLYKEADIWKNFNTIKTSGVTGPNVDEAEDVVIAIYTLNGFKVSKPVGGQVNIFRYRSGKTKKVFVPAY